MGFRAGSQHGLRLFQGRTVFHDGVAKNNSVEFLCEALPGIAGLRKISSDFPNAAINGQRPDVIREITGLRYVENVVWENAVNVEYPVRCPRRIYARRLWPIFRIGNDDERAEPVRNALDRLELILGITAERPAVMNREELEVERVGKRIAAAGIGVAQRTLVQESHMIRLLEGVFDQLPITA